jgi:hypothetical protein
VPLAGDKFALQMLAPIKPEIFNQLFDEGWPLDMLMRVLIERIEIVMEPPSGILVLENNPSLWDSNGASDEVNDAVKDGPKGYYDRFLRACALAREFQKHGLIYLAEKQRVMSAASAISGAPDTKELELAAKDGLIWMRSGDAMAESGNVTPSNTHATQASPTGWQLGKRTTLTFFRLASQPDPKDPTKLIASEMGTRLTSKLDTMSCYSGCDLPIATFVDVMLNGFNVTDDTSKDRAEVDRSKQAAGAAPAGSANAREAGAPGPEASEEGAAPKALQVRLVMRSLLGAMLAVANEDETFERFRARYTEEQIARHAAWDGKPGRLTIDPDNWAPLPESQLHPVLTLLAPKGPLPNTVAELDYRDKHFAIADPVPPPVGSSANWNRDVFRLLVQLSFLATTDPTAFQSPSLIQLH